MDEEGWNFVNINKSAKNWNRINEEARKRITITIGEKKLKA